MDEIKVGDRFLVEVTTTRRDTSHAWVCSTDGDDCIVFLAEALRRAKRLPRTLKVGDRVRYDGETFELVALHEGRAWLFRRHNGTYRAALAHFLTPAEDAP